MTQREAKKIVRSYVSEHLYQKGIPEELEYAAKSDVDKARLRKAWRELSDQLSDDYDETFHAISGKRGIRERLQKRGVNL